ncbi:MAG: methionyl-tRNA formyltransferase [Rikenellaceae bacterium]|nr:methionyl-tRNA formyltransferase [Rikenellaceae bacterium]
MDAKALKIVYMGTPEFAVAPLRALVENGFQVVTVVTMPDKPAGRGLKLQQSAVKKYALEAGLTILQPEKLRSDEFIAELHALQPDLGIVIAFRMLPQRVWSLPRLGTFNLHASLLPQYRGAAPINWALINGETSTGVTTFMLNAEIDKGAVIGRKEVTVAADETAGTLHDKLMHTGTELVLESVERIATGRLSPVEQSELETGALKEAPKIFKETCRIDWNCSVVAVYNLIRGLSPHPTAWSEITRDGKHLLNVKIYTAIREDVLPVHSPGSLVTDGTRYLKVACADGYIGIEELQLAGKKRMKTADFLRGFNAIGEYRFV